MADDSNSQTLKAILGLRGLIIDGHLPPGSRVSEAVVVENLGVSRTPARIALLRMKEQGFLNELPSGGFTVASFTPQDMFDTIEIRGTLEGMAARFAAERGVERQIATQLRSCVDVLDDIVNAPEDTFDLDLFIQNNDLFHHLLMKAANSVMLERSLERVKNLPFGGSNAFINSARSELPEVRRILSVAQDQHRSIVDAITQRQGARAQALALEHSFQATKYLRLALSASNNAAEPVPALRLVRGGLIT